MGQPHTEADLIAYSRDVLAVVERKSIGRFVSDLDCVQMLRSRRS